MLENKRTILFDTDGTLIHTDNTPRQDTIDMLNKYVNKGWNVGVWSGAGKEHAEQIGQRLGLQNVTYHSKEEMLNPDIAVDNEPFTSAKRVIKV